MHWRKLNTDLAGRGSISVVGWTAERHWKALERKDAGQGGSRPLFRNTGLVDRSPSSFFCTSRGHVGHYLHKFNIFPAEERFQLTFQLIKAFRIQSQPQYGHRKGLVIHTSACCSSRFLASVAIPSLIRKRWEARAASLVSIRRRCSAAGSVPDGWRSKPSWS